MVLPFWYQLIQVVLEKRPSNGHSRHGVQYEILGLASKYGLNTVQNSKSMVKDAIWTYFKHEVHFLVFFCVFIDLSM